MRPSILWLLVSLASITRASSIQSYILTIDQDDALLSSAVLEDMKSLVYNMGGKITHEYSLIKGFTMDASDELLPRLKEKLLELEDTFGYKVYLERDSEAHTFKSHDESLEKGDHS